MKKQTQILLLICLSSLSAFAQPTLNQRYIIDEEISSIFTSVMSNDSCYYVGGMQTSLADLRNLNSSFVRFNLDGTIDSLSLIKSDTNGIGFWYTNKIIPTLDENFAALAVYNSETYSETFMFIKFNKYGDTILTKRLNQFEDGAIIKGVEPSFFFQNADSTYYALVGGYRADDLRGTATFFKLDKTGNILYYKVYSGISAVNYRVLTPNSLICYAANKLIIAASLRHSDATKPNIRYHTKLLVIDTLGNLIEEHTYWEDTLALGCKGLTKTVDGGLIYGGLIGRYFPEAFSIRYIAQIVKLNADYTLGWKILLGKYIGLGWIGIEKIIAIGNREYVAVGMTTSTTDRTGWLIKFNDAGEFIWERKYFKVPHFTGETNYPRHELYDVALTADSGFVMVGQAINYYADNGFLPGQKAWLVKTDKYGCLVPGCQLADTTGKPKPIDSTVVETPPILTIYPNPTSTSIFYYHHQDNFQFGTAYIYNMQGDIVQKWEISTNDITYEIDVSTLAAGQYILKVFNELGEPLETAKFVKV